jgi:methylenetetrahydrofolate dehydrogenase (NADP+)/methenyltetrahydrofolate cyclohydrolase
MNIKEYVQYKKSELKEQISSLKVKPCFVIIQVNDDPASNSYIKGKMKDANEVGINCILQKYDPNISQEELINEINIINNNKDIHGLIVQMPLPKHIDEEIIKLAVNPKKDIDGFHPLSTLDPCTPKGIINYLKFLNLNFVGKNAVVIGRSNIVGKPMGKLLLKEHCNVTTLHSRTTKEDMHWYIAHADIIVVAVGRPHFLDETYTYKKDAVIVDVGINRVDGVLVGDAKNDLPVQIQTPVPGGVGLLTRLNLLMNLMEAYKNEI